MIVELLSKPSSKIPVSNGIKSINKDLGPLTLPPSAFSASSVYQDKPEYQPHKANIYLSKATSYAYNRSYTTPSPAM
ncbi:unnamed protein product [Trichobilharzia regenti]|nr:unnamed protein product [Trichobilharzia regenti]